METLDEHCMIRVDAKRLVSWLPILCMYDSLLGYT